MPVRRIVITIALILLSCGYLFQDDLVFLYADTRKTENAYRTYLDWFPAGKHSFEADWKIQSIIHPATYSIGVYTGTSPFDFSNDGANPVIRPKDITDRQATLVADPFMIRKDRTWYMFFEVENGRNRQGDIGYATSEDGFSWKYQKIVLDEPFHLSYPYVFRHDDNYYMIPESNQASAVRLYRAVEFPAKWEFTGTLLEGRNFADNSLLNYDNRWWLFSETSSMPHDNGTLRLYFADNLTGPWKEHPKSPIIKGNPNIARPGGRIISYGNELFRYTQDCYPVYGYQVFAFKITTLTPKKYSETLYRKTPIVAASGNGWNRLGMHHVDPHRLDNGKWLVSVDGQGDI